MSDSEIQDGIARRVANGVAYVTITRADRGNALDHAARERLREVFEGFNHDHGVRAVVLTGEGDRHFCNGADLSRSRPERDPALPERMVGERRRILLEGYYRLIPAVIDCEVPVIAAVNGTAAGAGAHLALACDLVLLSDRGRFIEVFARRGLTVDALGTYLLPRLIGPQRAKELAFFADDIDASTALEYGLVNRVIDHDALAATAAEWAHRLATGPTRAHALNKWLINQSLDRDRASMIDNEAWAVDLNGFTEDAIEGVASFRERRPPEWRGY